MSFVGYDGSISIRGRDLISDGLEGFTIIYAVSESE
jgi:hypothetical protein